MTGNPPKVAESIFEGPVFEGFRVREGAPLSRLIATLVEAPNVGRDFSDHATQLLAGALLTTADEISLLTGLNDDLDRSEEVERVLYRAQHRAIVMVEIARRLTKGEVDR